MGFEHFSVYIYFALSLVVTLIVLAVSSLFSSKKDAKAKFKPYESGLQTETHLLQERFPLHHYVVALLFLILDVEVVFLYPWSVVGHTIGTFAFYEMLFFLVALLIGFAYAWKKGGLEWD